MTSTETVLNVQYNGRHCDHRHTSMRSAINCLRLKLRELGYSQNFSTDRRSLAVEIVPMKIEDGRYVKVKRHGRRR